MRFIPGVLVLILVTSAPVFASTDSPPPFGRYHGGLELGYMAMQHETFETDDVGLYVGMSGYGHLANGWYVGGELGTGSSIMPILADESSYTPLEVNAKRAFALSRVVTAGVGGGFSLSRVRFVDNNWFGFGDDVEIVDWLPGGQVFGELVLKGGWAFVGLKLEYTLTADSDEISDQVQSEKGWDYSNLKFGFQVGVMGL